MKPDNLIHIWPTLITLSSTTCGFASIVVAASSNTTSSPDAASGLLFWAVALIFFAMIFDTVDGRLARLTNSTSKFGGMLDSLSDVISFGVAPAFLTRAVVLASGFIPRESPFADKIIWLVSILFVLCAVMRLARFTVEADPDDKAHLGFWGLPTPAAAGVVASIALIHLSVASSTGLQFVGRFILPVMTLIGGILMVSRIRYPHLASVMFKGKKSFSYLILLVVVMMVAIPIWDYALAFLFLCYMSSGVLGLALERVVEHFDLAKEQDGFF